MGNIHILEKKWVRGQEWTSINHHYMINNSFFKFRKYIKVNLRVYLSKPQFKLGSIQSSKYKGVPRSCTK